MTGMDRRENRPLVWWAWAGLASLYLLTRLLNLRAMPLFVDEGNNLWRAQSFLQGDLLRAFAWGKPLDAWLIAVPLALGVDPVWAARGVHVLAGLVGLWAVVQTARRLGGNGAALLAGGLYVVVPYLLFFERLTTPDVLLAGLGMLSIYLTLDSLETGAFRRCWLTGAVLVLAVLAKSPLGYFFCGLPALMVVLSPRLRPVRWACLVRIYVLPVLLALAMAAAVFVRWRFGLQPLGFGLDEILMKATTPAAGAGRVARNLVSLYADLRWLLTWPLLLWLAGAWLAALLVPRPALRLLALAGGGWLLIFCLTAGFWSARYQLPALPPLVTLMGWAAWQVIERLAAWLGRPQGAIAGKRWRLGLSGLLAVFTIGWLLPPDVLIVTRPQQAPLPPAARQEYVTGSASGYGFPEAATLLAARLADDSGALVVALHISDYVRLDAYLPPELRGRLRQVHILTGGEESEGGRHGLVQIGRNLLARSERAPATSEQIALVQAWHEQVPVIYVLQASQAQWTEAWQQAFPGSQVVATFARPGGQTAVVVRQLTSD